MASITKGENFRLFFGYPKKNTKKNIERIQNSVDCHKWPPSL